MEDGPCFLIPCICTTRHTRDELAHPIEKSPHRRNTSCSFSFSFPNSSLYRIRGCCHEGMYSSIYIFILIYKIQRYVCIHRERERETRNWSESFITVDPLIKHSADPASSPVSKHTFRRRIYNTYKIFLCYIVVVVAYAVYPCVQHNLYESTKKCPSRLYKASAQTSHVSGIIG
jgi:hypothetical protein